MSFNAAQLKAIRELMVYVLGGKCSVCGTTECLEIHHKTGPGMGTDRDRDKRAMDWMQEHLKGNLSLLCRSCHTKVHK